MVRKTQITHSRESDLLVRFGIDSTVGRMVTRTLVWLILFQPVYVALGAEIEESVEETGTETEVVEKVVEQTLPTQETEASEEPTESVPAEDVSEETMGEEGTVNEESAPVEETIVDEETPVTSEEPTADTEGQQASKTDVSDDTVATDRSESVQEEQGDATDTTESSETTTQEETSDATDESDTKGDELSETTETEEVAHDADTGGSTSSGGGGGGSSSNSNDDEDESSNPDDAADTSPTGDTDVDAVGDVATTSDQTATDAERASSTDEGPLATTSDPAIAAATEGEVRTVAQDPSSKYVFGEGDCTVVADGEFYCVSTDADRLATGDPRVYAEKDREGDREIFYFDGVEVKRITNNAYDDFAPVFEEEQMRVVWQAMLNDRLQIMVHDIMTNTTRQITTSRQNSSNPDIEGDLVVWQEWIETNWEIMMTDVDNNGAEFEIERITDNAIHDMFPQAYDGLVTWQREKSDSWEVLVYDLRTGKQTVLEKNEDTKYENPRFVLLFDSKHDNGDVETIGYDLDTGEMMELGTRPRPLPVDPVTPDDETQEALPREAASSTQLKVGREGDDDTPEDLTL